MDNTLRIGLIGVGALALRGILPHLSQRDVTDRVTVEALCDPVLERAEAAARIYDVPRAFANVDEMLAESEIDAVTVASPIGLHYEHCRVALEAGKHVHVNKTMTTTVHEANELIALAEQRDLCIVASPGDMLLPQVTRTRELIESGAIGTLCWAICGLTYGDYHEGEPERRDAPGGTPIDPSWYFRAPGGGPMYDVSVYALHQLTSVLGPARAVAAVSGIRIPERVFLGARIPTAVDDNTLLLLDFGDGLFAVAYGTAAGGTPISSPACCISARRDRSTASCSTASRSTFPEASWSLALRRGGSCTCRSCRMWSASTGNSPRRTSSRTSCSSSTGCSTGAPHR